MLDRLLPVAYPVALGAAVAALVGLGEALARIREHGYAALGFQRNALAVALDVTLPAALAGAALGVAWLIARTAIPAIRRRLPPPLQDPRAAGVLACWVAASGGFALRALADGRVSALRAAIAVVAATTASGLLLRLDPTRLRVRWRRFRPPGSASWALPAVAPFAVMALPRSCLEHLREPEVAASVAVALVLGGMGTVLAAGLERPAGRRVALLALLPLAIPLVLTLAGWSLPPTLEARRPLNVLLIGIDTLREDRVPLDPGARDLTPNLRGLAARGIAFESAVSQSPWTMPAFASVMTGRYPREHGAISLGGRLPADQLTLAEILREASYRTGGVVSHVFVDAQHGFGQGFDDFDEHGSLGHWDITSAEVTDTAIRWLARHRSSRFFLFVHYFDPHYEYRDHEAFEFSNGYDGWLRHHPLDIRDLRHRAHRLAPEDREHLTDLYDEEVAYTDRQIGRLLDHLAEAQLDPSTLIVVVGDHGEEFLERGWLGHTITLHDEVVRVPLIVAGPGLAEPARRATGTVETRAVFGTVLDALGIDPRPAAAVDAPTLPIQGTEQAVAPAFSEVWLPDAPLSSGKRVRLSAVRTDSWKLIVDHDRGLRELYDLEHDPGETVDRYAGESTIPEELDRLLESWLKRMEMAAPGAQDGSIDEGLRERLEALGYL